MSNTGYIIFLIILLIVVCVQQFYIQRLKKGIEYAAQILKKYETALLMDEIIERVNEDGSKKHKAVHK